MKALITAALLSGLATPVLAVSGSDLLSGGATAEGYAWGAVEYRWQVNDDDDPNLSADQQKIIDCLTKGNITSSTFIEVVRQQVRNDPKLMPQPAMRAILLTLNDMCPVD